MPRRPADIACFEELLPWLRDELGWPVGEADVDDLVFDYDPSAELGLPPDSGAKVLAVRQLRPIGGIDAGGAIFNVGFGERHLPLRLVLHVLEKLVADAATWPQRWRQTFPRHPARPVNVWGGLSQEHKMLLVSLYPNSNHTVDALPYTPDFLWLWDRFNRDAGLALTPHEFWRALSSARKGNHLPKKQSFGRRASRARRGSMAAHPNLTGFAPQEATDDDPRP